MMHYTIKQLKRLYLFKVFVIYAIATFLINQGVEALVIAQFVPVMALRISLTATAILFPFVMYVAWVIINKKTAEEESYEDRIINLWLLIFSVLLLGFTIFEQLNR
ncbi:MAG TPA: hypothetical protein VJ964_14745 [Balneolaceae bacterium]|nr:hypothetical protein [Balneolaceae bacterium]